MKVIGIGKTGRKSSGVPASSSRGKGRIRRWVGGTVLSLLACAVVVTGLGAQQAGASGWFEVQQREQFRTHADIVVRAGKAVDGMLNVYIGAPGDLPWGDPQFVRQFETFAGEVAALDRLLSVHRKTIDRSVSSDLKKLKRIGVPKNARRCSDWRMSRAALRDARALLRKLDRNFDAVATARALLREEIDVIRTLIDGPGASSEGYLDGAVYDFGSGQMIYPPPSDEDSFVDPYVIGRMMDALYNFSARQNPIFMSSFNHKMEKAVKFAKKAARTCAKN